MSSIEGRGEEQSRERDLLPVVARPPAGVPTGVLILAVALAGALLFAVLEARRTRLTAPATTAPATASAESPPPPLVIPPEAQPAAVAAPELALPPPPPQPQAAAPPRAPMPAPAAPAFLPIAPRNTLAEAPAPARIASGPALVFDRGPEPSAPGGRAGETGHGQDQGLDQAAVRARAGMFANRATTVPQGTLIPAILETGFDSTRAGSARALVQRDIRGFDGSRVLVPRGSRLIGQYQSDVTAGQNRALILWTRLIRPDGGTIALASPVTDTEGRTGARAHVNTHFLAQFSNAFFQTILQSGLNIGTALATRGTNSAVVLALPGSFPTTTSPTTPSNDIKPTLTVAPGTSISVLVARDLDFTDVEARP